MFMGSSFVKISLFDNRCFANTKSVVYLDQYSLHKSLKTYFMTNLRNLKITLAVAAVAITSVFVLSSWDFKNSNAVWNDYGYDECDTVPKKQNKEKKIRDLDDVIDELNDADFKIDMEKIQRELRESMKKLDMQKIQLDMEKAMKDVDFEKIRKEFESSMSKVDLANIQKEMANAMKEFDAVKLQKELQESMSKIDFEKIEKEMANAMKEFDAVKLQKELQESMSKIEWEKMKTEFDKVKEIDMKKMQLDMEKVQDELSKIGPEIEKSMEQAKVGIEKAKVEMKEYNEFVDGLEKDGLLKRKDGYTIKHVNDELFINGKKASDATYNKYKPFLEKHKKFNIEKTDDDFDMDID